MFRFVLLPEGAPICSLPTSIIGAAGTALLFAVTVAPVGSGAHRAAESETATREVVYMLPLLPPRREKPVAIPGIRWIVTDVMGSGLAPEAEKGDTPAGAGEHGRGPGRKGMRPQGKDAESETPPPAEPDPVGGAVFVETEVDHPVERDPSSAAPQYPPFLEQQRIEGAVVVQYVVDTTGSADSATLVVNETTNPAFAESVRAALPRMRFQPAEFKGRRVRQLVRQEFKFVIPPEPKDTVETARTS
jgi:TonB family protein